MPSRPKTFQARRQQDRQALNAQYDARRGSARSRGYSAAWDKAAALFKRRHRLCLGRVTAAEVVDHVEPHKGDRDKFWNEARWQSSCKWHHDVVKQALEAMFYGGEITLDDLWLNSAAAIRLTLERLGQFDG
jgi:5-methylcytosine-specific restriction enzyme A